jgi:hypothetical protein
MDNRVKAGLAIFVGLALGWGIQLKGDGATGFSLIVQQSGTTKGAAVTMNCSTNVTCSLSGGIVTVTASGGGGSSSGNGTSGWSGLPLTFVSNTTQYAPPVGGALTSTTESVVQLKASSTAPLLGLQVTVSAALGVAATLSVTLRDGGSTTALTCTTASGGTTCGDTTHVVNVTQGDLLSFVLVSSGTVTAGLPQVEIGYAIGGSSSVTTAITLVQAIGSRGTSPTLTTLAFPHNVISGDILGVCLGWESTTSANPSATDTVGTTYAVVIGENGQGANGNAACLIGTAAGSGANTVTVSWPASSSFEGIYLSEWNNLTATADGTAAGVFSHLNFTNLSITTATAGDLIMMFTNINTSMSTRGCWVRTSTLYDAQTNDAGINCSVVQAAAGLVTNGSWGEANTQPTTEANATVMFALKP